jgi:hypothetical protein
MNLYWRYYDFENDFKLFNKFDWGYYKETVNEFLEEIDWY